MLILDIMYVREGYYDADNNEISKEFYLLENFSFNIVRNILESI